MKIREDRTIWTASKLMNRRQAIKRTALLSGGMVLLKHSLLGQASSLSIPTSAAFGPNEESLLQLVVDTLIPATDTPGAKELKVDQFVLLMVNDCHSEEDQTAFYAGLHNLDAFTEKHFGQSFTLCDADTRVEALNSLSKSPDTTPELQAFFKITKDRTIQGYLESKYVMTEALPHKMIPDPYDGYYPASKLGGEI
jgi:hypothetical protein